jgi:hypothetical protein
MLLLITTAEYLEQALHFDRLAAEEKVAELKVELERRADVCRRLAAGNAKQLNEPLPLATPK